MHDLQFADAAIPAPLECLGLPLATYTVRHELLLLRHRSPFLCGSTAEFNALPKPQQVFALTLAVQICAERPAGWLWRWRQRRVDYPLAIAEFNNYLDAGRRLLPTLNSNEQEDRDVFEMCNNGEKMTKGRSLGSPFVAQLITFALVKLRLNYQEALDSPFAHLGNLYFAHLESEGGLSIENSTETKCRAERAEDRRKINDETAQAKAAWLAAKTPAEQAAAYEKYPRIGNFFAAEWRMVTTDPERDALVARWGIVAERELEKAGITRTPKP